MDSARPWMISLGFEVLSSPARAHLPEIVNAPGTAQVRVFTAQGVSS